MKTVFTLLCTLALGIYSLRADEVNVVVPEELNPDVVRDAGNLALDEALDELFTMKGLPKTFAVAPLVGDHYEGYYTSQLRNKLASKGNQHGIELYTLKGDESFNSLLAGMTQGQQMEGILDPSTVQQIGNLIDAEGIVSGRLESVTLLKETSEVRVRMTIQAYKVETGRFLWGTEATGTLVDSNLEKKFGSYVDDASKGLKNVSATTWYIVAGIVVFLIVLKLVFGSIKKARQPR